MKEKHLTFLKPIIKGIEADSDWWEGNLANLNKSISKLNDSPDSNLPIDAGRWPSWKDYNSIIRAIRNLDPIGSTRKKKNPFWKHPLTAVDRGYPDVRLKKALEGFVSRAIEQLINTRSVPKPARAFFWLFA